MLGRAWRTASVISCTRRVTQRVRADQECIGPLFNKRRKGRVDVNIFAGGNDFDLPPNVSRVLKDWSDHGMVSLACRLLLPREEGGDPAPSRAVMFTAWMKWDQRLWREHDRRRERMLRHAQ
jgi:hypothetical protein